jgi:hypothetical protein
VNNYEEKIIEAFPRYISSEVASLLSKIVLKTILQPQTFFTVTIQNERVEIPYRIYFEYPGTDNLSGKELLILNCLFTRHHSGYLRQKYLERIILSDEYFVTPFIIQLLGEYVVEILHAIENNLNDTRLSNLARFAKENPAFFEATKSRMISYWDVYYRIRTWPKNKKEIRNYVGSKVVKAIEENRNSNYPG